MNRPMRRRSTANGASQLIDVHEEHQRAVTKAAIERLIQGLAAAWNNGDGCQFASFFAAQAQYVSGEGKLIRGRDAIENLVSGNRPPPAIAIENVVVTAVSDKEATTSFRWEGRDGNRRGTISCIVVNQHGLWLIEDLRNREDP